MILLVEPGNFVIIYQFLMGFILTLLISVLSVNIKFLRFIGSIAIAGFDFTPIPAQHEWCSRIEDGKNCGRAAEKFREISCIKNDFVNLTVRYFRRTNSLFFNQGMK